MMSNFNEHLQYGWLSHFVGTLLLIPLLMLEIPVEFLIGAIGIALPITLFASVMPDIDHPSSITYRLFKYSILCTVAIITAITLGQYSFTIGLFWLTVFNSIPYAVIVLTISSTALVSGLATMEAFSIIRPAHRGPTHNLFFGLIASTIIGLVSLHFYSSLVSADYSVIFSLIITGYVFIGFLSHIKADGLLLQPNRILRPQISPLRTIKNVKNKIFN